MSGAKKVHGKWIPKSDLARANTAKFKTAEQFAQTTEDRYYKKLPIKSVTAQELDIKKWFNPKTGEFSKEGYTLTKHNDGSYTIKADPRKYTKYYKNYFERGKDTRKEYGTYVPHEIKFDFAGKIVSEIKRDDYKDSDKDTDKYRKYTRKVYDQEIKQYGNDGKLISKKMYDDYEERDYKYDSGDRKRERDVYLKKDYDYSKSVVTSKERPDTRDKYKVKQADGSYKSYSSKSKYESAQRKQERFEQEYKSASSNEEKSKILKKYGAKVSVTTPTGKTYSSSNIDWLEGKYEDDWKKAETGKYYSLTSGKQVDLSKVGEYDNDRFAYDKTSGATIDRFKQQSVQAQDVTYEKPVYSNTFMPRESYEPMQKDYYTKIAMEKNLVPNPDAPKIPMGIIQPYVDDRSWLRKGIDWIDYRTGQLLHPSPTDTLDVTGLFGGHSPVISKEWQKEVAEDYKKGYGLFDKDYKGDSKFLQFSDKAGDLMSVPVRTTLGVGGSIFGQIDNLSQGLKNIVFDQLRYDVLKIPEYKTKYEKEVEQKRNELQESLSRTEFENNQKIKELAQLEAKQQFDDLYIQKQDELIANNEKAKAETIAYLELELKNPTISKNKYIEIENQINNIKGMETQKEKQRFGFLPQSNYKHYATSAYWGAFVPKTAESLYGFFSQPINWHPYGALTNIGGQTVTTGGENLKGMGEAIVTDPLRTATDIYLINKAYSAPSYVRSKFGKKYDTTVQGTKIPKEFIKEYKAYVKAQQKLFQSSRKMSDPKWMRVESIPNKQVAGMVDDLFKKNPDMVLGGSTAIEMAGVKLKRAPQDIEGYTPKPKVMAKQFKTMLDKAGMKQGKDYIMKKNTDFWFNKGGQFKEGLTIHDISQLKGNIYQVKQFSGMPESFYYKKTPNGITTVDPVILTMRSRVGAFEYNPTAVKKAQKAWEGRGYSPAEALKKAQAETYYGYLSRYSKDAPRLHQLSESLFQQNLARAQKYPPIIKQIQQYRMGQGLEQIKPYIELSKGKARVSPRPNYYGGKTSKLAGLKYVDFNFPDFGSMMRSKKGSYYGAYSSTKIPRYDYSPIYNFGRRQLGSIKYPIAPMYDSQGYLPPQPIQNYGGIYPTSQYPPTSGFYPRDKYGGINIPKGDYPVAKYGSPQFIPTPYTPYVPSTSYTTYAPIETPIPVIVPTEPDEPPKKSFKYDPEEEKEKKWYKKKRKYKTKLDRVQDPYFRILGKSKYSMDINKLLRDRYGNIYA